MGEPARLAQSPLDLQFGDVLERYPEAALRQGEGVTVVSIPGVRLPNGWSKAIVTVHFLVPAGYPHANPDCFNVDADLRLAGGAMPESAAIQAMPLIGNTIWFSWHLQRAWRPGRDSLLTWLGVIINRFEERR